MDWAMLMAGYRLELFKFIQEFNFAEIARREVLKIIRALKYIFIYYYFLLIFLFFLYFTLCFTIFGSIFCILSFISSHTQLDPYYLAK